MEIDFELDKIYEVLDSGKYKKILIQLPDGLKPYAKEIYDKIKSRYKDIQIFIWLGSNFGGCDIPVYLDKYGFDLIIHFGHSKFYKLKLI
ncbi:MAG: diphthamide synthesis protein [Nanopusillaceae archaeon]